MIMYIIIVKEKSKESILNILYSSDHLDVRTYIMDYLNDTVNSLLMAPNSNGIKNVSYSIEENAENFVLIKSYKKVSQGYIYNSSQKTKESLFSIYYLTFDGNVEFKQNSNDALYTDINSEINKRVLKQFDQDSLYQVILQVCDNVNIKNDWTKKEYTNMVSETIKNFKKELYSDVAKKLKRYGKQTF